MTFKNFINSLNGEEVEGKIIKSIAYSLISSIVLLIVIHLLFISSIEINNLYNKYGLYVLLLTVGYSIIIPSMGYIYSYKRFACMSGMMIGMTSGMIIGFLPGFFVGATSGMFWGSVVGMAIGIPIGIFSGKCCGIMGIMEGLMSGFMGGLMGAMTSVMMINDNLKIMSVIISFICIAIIIGLIFMVYEETRKIKGVRFTGYTKTIIMTILINTITTLFILFGPRSALFL